MIVMIFLPERLHFAPSKCRACDVDRELVSAERHEAWSYLCPICKAVLRFVVRRQPKAEPEQQW